jgi:hypothetical protein
VFGILLLPNIFLSEISGDPILLLVAVSQEGLQLWGAGRLLGRGEVFDLLVDVGGAELGWLALRKLNRGQASGINEVKNG